MMRNLVHGVMADAAMAMMGRPRNHKAIAIMNLW